MLEDRSKEVLDAVSKYFAEWRTGVLFINQTTGRVRNPVEFELNVHYRRGATAVELSEFAGLELEDDEIIISASEIINLLETSNVWKKLKFNELRKLLPESILEEVSDDLDKWELRADEERRKDSSRKKCAISDVIERKEAELKNLYAMLKQWEDQNV